MIRRLNILNENARGKTTLRIGNCFVCWARVLLLIIMFMGMTWTISGKAEEKRNAMIVSIAGEVQVRKAGGEWESAKVGEILFEGDEIRTAREGSAELIIDGGKTGVLEVSGYSRLRFNTLKEEVGTGKKMTLLDMAIGRVMMEVEKLEHGSVFEVNTPTITMGVQGTRFEVVVREK